MSEANSTNAVETEEHYEFAALPSAGKINVANHAHETVSEHIYTVSMANGRATRCTCPSDKYHEGPCKHREAVEDRDDFAREGNCEVCGDTGEHNDVDCFACVEIEEPIEVTG